MHVPADIKNYKICALEKTASKDFTVMLSYNILPYKIVRIAGSICDKFEYSEA
jgi:hypothetical protein